MLAWFHSMPKWYSYPILLKFNFLTKQSEKRFLPKTVLVSGIFDKLRYHNLFFIPKTPIPTTMLPKHWSWSLSHYKFVTNPAFTVESKTDTIWYQYRILSTVHHQLMSQTLTMQICEYNTGLDLTRLL